MKTWSLLLCIMLFALTSQAQRSNSDLTEVGIFVGPNLTGYSIEAGGQEASARLGYQVGAFVRYGHLFFAQTGLTYYSLNSQLTDNSSSLGTAEDRVNLQYVQVPLMAGFRISNLGERARALRIQAGPSMQILSGVGENELQLTSDDYRNLTFNALLSVGLDVWFFSLDAGYQWGLSNVFTGSSPAEAQKQIASLSIGVTF